MATAADGAPAAEPAAAPAYDAALAEMLAAPSDPGASFRFVQAAVAAGETRAAIATLERLLVLDPSLDNLRLELGVLYLREGATQLAESQIESALASPDAPPEVRARAEALLEEARAGNDPLDVHGAIFLGGRIDSNPAATPGSGTVQIVVEGVEVAAQLDSSAVADSDYGAVALMRGGLDYDLGYQRGHLLSANGYYYGTRYAHEKEQNLDVLSGDLGPRFFLDDGGAASVRPFVIATYVRKDAVRYLFSGGAGVDLFAPLEDGIAARLYAVALGQDFFQTSKEPAANDRDGAVFSARPKLEWSPVENTVLGIGADVRYNSAREGYETFWDAGPFVTAARLFPSPFDAEAEPWLLDAVASYRHRRYRNPDPAIDLDDAQRDDRFDVRLTLTAPIAPNVAVVAESGYTFNGSNYAIEEFDNVYGSLGIEIEF